MDRRTRALIESFVEEDIEVLKIEQGRGTHVKVFCRHGEHEFFYVCSINVHGSDQRAVENRQADLRRIKRAIASGNQDVMSKFKVKRVRDGQAVLRSVCQ